MKIKMLETVESRIYVPMDGGVMPAPLDAAAAAGSELSRHELRPARGTAEYELVWKFAKDGTYDSVPDDAAGELIAGGWAQAV